MIYDLLYDYHNYCNLFTYNSHIFRVSFRSSITIIDRFHSRGKQLCKFVGTKTFFYIRKVSIPNGCFFVQQHGRRFHCFVHQYGRRDVR